VGACGKGCAPHRLDTSTALRSQHAACTVDHATVTTAVCSNQHDVWSMSLTGSTVVPAGDFNGWSWDTPLERGEYGVWSVRLPHGASCSLPLITAALGCCAAASTLRPLQMHGCARCRAQLEVAPG
jgi:hypothetical protein